MNKPLNKLALAIHQQAFNHQMYRDNIITSFFDIDAYKLHMQQAVYQKYPDVEVEYAFVDRNKEGLAKYLPEIVAEINKLENLRYTDDQLAFLREKVTWLKSSFIEYLRDFRLDPRRYVRCSDNNGQLEIRVKGPWLKTIHFEIFILAIVSEVRNRNLYPTVPHEQLRKTIIEKIKYCKQRIKELNVTNFRFMEFSTRRRASYQAQSYVIDALSKHMPNEFIGTSNYHFAKEKDIPFHGTVAHEWYMAHQVLSPLAIHQMEACRVWDEVFEGNLGVGLTDSVDTPSFLTNFTTSMANRFSGLRQDSGDPIAWGEMVLKKYEELNVDATTKKLLFTDGLNFEKALQIAKHFEGRAIVIFGLGTFLAGDLGEYVNEQGQGFKPVNIVMKLIYVNGSPVAKISDEAGKSISPCPYHLMNLKAMFNIPMDVNENIELIKKVA